MSGEADMESRPGPSIVGTKRVTPATPTGIPFLDTAAALGPPGATYEEEFNKLRAHLQKSGNVLGPSAPVIFVNIVRRLYERSCDIAADPSLSPYNKCVFLFQVFDTIVLAYKNLSFVYCDADGARSVYGYSALALKNVLSRIEAIARIVAVAVHDTYSLTVLNNVVASAKQRLSAVQSDKDMLEFFRGVSGTVGYEATASSGADHLPPGVERYRDPYPEVDTLLRRLYEFASDKHYVSDFHDAMFLIATANEPATLSSALETRLADMDRNIVWLDSPGDRVFASSLCASAIGFLRKRLNKSSDGNPLANGIETYRINYGRLFSKYRGESERNFDGMMEWIKNAVRGGDKFRIFWFPDIENLMSERTSSDQEHIATIKNAMLQHMDDFNKDRTLRSFLLLFHSSEGSLDSAFARRLETVVKCPPDPLTDASVAGQAVSAELARYHINLTDETVARVAAQAGATVSDEQRQQSRVGGYANVQTTLRDMYVNQKLALRYDARAIDARNISVEMLNRLIGRHLISSEDTLYDLDERPILLGAVSAVAYGPAAGLENIFGGTSVQIKYNAAVRGDPKNIDETAAARTIFLHHV